MTYERPPRTHTGAAVPWDGLGTLSHGMPTRSRAVDEWEALGPGMKIDRRATDWGLAALGINGAFLIMAPVMLFFNDFYAVIGIHHAAPNEVETARIAGVVIGALFLGLIGFGIFCGFRGLG